MASRTKIIVFSSIFLLIIIAFAFGFFMYNKGPVDIENSKGVSVTANELYHVYHTDSSGAAEKYTDRILVVEGQVFDISMNAQQQKVVLLKTGTELAYINCTLEGPAEDIKLNDKISVKGICSGIGQGYPEMGIMADLYLTRCFIAN